MQLNLSDITIDDSDIPDLDTAECAELSTNNIILGGLASISDAHSLIDAAISIAAQALARKNPEFEKRLGGPHIVRINESVDRMLSFAAMGSLIYRVDLLPIAQIRVNSRTAESFLTVLKEDPALTTCLPQITAVGRLFTYVDAEMRGIIRSTQKAPAHAESPL